MKDVQGLKLGYIIGSQCIKEQGRGVIKMNRRRIGHKKDIVLAVAAVRKLEQILAKTSRKRTLTSEYRQKLLKGAAYLRRKRITASSERVVLPKSCWIKVLRFFAQLVAAKHLRDVFDKLMGG